MAGSANETNDAALALVLFQERGSPPSSQSRSHASGWIGTRILHASVNAAVAVFQPAPHLMHAELLVVDPTGGCWHFSTYLGDEARWRDSDEYYEQHNWRALPVAFERHCVERVAQICDSAARIGTPYSVARYPFASWVLGAAASTLSDGLGDPAQCAALTARILTRACAQRLKWSCPRYSPSDLYNELQTGAGCSRAPAETTCDPEALGILRQGTRAQLQQLNSDRRALALKSLARRVGEQASLLALCGRPANAAEQRELGWAAVRCAAMSKGPLEIREKSAAAQGGV